MDELYTIPEASKMLRLSPATIRAWLFQKRLGYVKLGRRTLLRGVDLEEMITKNLVPSNGGNGRTGDR